ncbi:MAG: ABC transporter permease subunit [Fimbriimonadaceae bacterium]|nr:ABC transporter permease subunit [Fimbriimonadaceae bacterium]
MIELYLFKTTLIELIRAKRLVVWLLVIAAFFAFGKVFTMVRAVEDSRSTRVIRTQTPAQDGSEGQPNTSNQVEGNRAQPDNGRAVDSPGGEVEVNESEPEVDVSEPPVALTKQEKERDAYATLSGWLVFRLLALIAAIFAAVVVAQEVEQKTIVYLLTRPVPRPKILLARTAAAIVVTFVIGAIAALAVSVSVMGTAGFTNDLMLRDIKALFVGAAAYVSLFVLISLWLNRSMLICLLFAFGWEMAIPNMPGTMYRLSIFSYLTAIAERPSSGGQLNTLGTGLSGELSSNILLPSTGYLTMGFLIVACLGLGAWWFKNFEYVPREDAE